MRICECENRYSNSYIKLYFNSDIRRSLYFYKRIFLGNKRNFFFFRIIGCFFLILGIVFEIRKFGCYVGSS